MSIGRKRTAWWVSFIIFFITATTWPLPQVISYLEKIVENEILGAALYLLGIFLCYFLSVFIYVNLTEGHEE